MDTLSIVEFNPEAARHVASWRYEPPYDLYNLEPADAARFLDREATRYGYYAVVDIHVDVVGFCCFGSEARVAGQEPEPETLDIGGGVRPDLLSQGLATRVLPAVLEFGLATFALARFRIAVASFNERSLRLCRSAGFVTTRTFDGPGRQFDELERSAATPFDPRGDN